MKQENGRLIRQSNFELMRIISMFMIVVYHFLMDGNLLKNSVGNLHIVLEWLSFLIVVHVNSFVLLTGYFQYDRKFKKEKLFHLLNLSWFYRVMWVILFIIVGVPEISQLTIFQELSPIDLNWNHWFIVTYILLYVLSPFLNFMIQKMDQRQHRKLLIVLFFLFCFIPFLTARSNFYNDGTLAHFIFLYFLGSYFHKYPLRENWHFKNYSVNKIRIILISVMLLCTAFNYTNTLFMTNMAFNQNEILHWIGSTIAGYRFMYWNPLIIIQSVCYFLFFETLHVKNRGINFVSSYVLDVYLIHTPQLIKKYLYKWLHIDIGINLVSWSMLVKVLMFSLGIFIIGISFGFIREKLFEFVRKRKLSQKISGKVHHYIENF